MPRYYFHLDNEVKIEDDEGTQFATLDDAKAHARDVASQMSAHQTEPHNKGLSIAVTDEHGKQVFRFPLEAKDEPPRR